MLIKIANRQLWEMIDILVKQMQWSPLVYCTNMAKNQILGAGPSQPAQPDRMHQIYFSKTIAMPHISLMTHETPASFYSYKCSENHIVRAGPAQPAQLDVMLQICLWRTNEMSNSCSFPKVCPDLSNIMSKACKMRFDIHVGAILSRSAQTHLSNYRSRCIVSVPGHLEL